MWMTLENIPLVKASRHRNHELSRTQNIQDESIHGNTEQRGGCQGQGG